MPFGRAISKRRAKAESSPAQKPAPEQPTTRGRPGAHRADRGTDKPIESHHSADTMQFRNSFSTRGRCGHAFLHSELQQTVEATGALLCSVWSQSRVFGLRGLHPLPTPWGATIQAIHATPAAVVEAQRAGSRSRSPLREMQQGELQSSRLRSPLRNPPHPPQLNPEPHRRSALA